MTVITEIRDGLHILAMNDGKLNCVTMPMRRSLVLALDAAAADPLCKAVILIGKGRAFSAGADLNEMNSEKALSSPRLHDTVLSIIEDMSVPVVAALHGSALGGGLELALACSYRVAKADTMLGLPEVALGLMPGAGGTQRLPRAIGVEAALNMALSGKLIPAAKAKEGLIDRIIDGDLLEGAVAFAREIASIRPIPRLNDVKIDRNMVSGFLQFSRGVAKMDPRRLPGLIPIIDAVEASITMAPADGGAFEFKSFKKLMKSDESQPFRYAFLAERATASISGVDPKTARPVLKVAIIGAGTMGSGIAIALAQAGIEVQILDLNPDALQRGLSHCRNTWDRSVSKGKLTQAKRDRFVARIEGVESYDQIADCDLVIEAVVEQMSVKKDVFSSLDAVMKKGAVLATNTSSLNVDEIAASTMRPEDVVGLHFFSPANIMQLLEIVRGKETADDVLATSLALAKRIRKVPVVAGVCDGFIGNRMIDSYLAQAMYLLEEGATPSQVDLALEKWGMAMGPFRMSDVVGNDVPWDGRKHRRAANLELKSPVIADEVCERGWFGQKTGLGWYKYVPGARKPAPNPELSAVMEAVSAKLSLHRRRISDEEIVHRCIFALVNEGAAILADGYAQRGSDIDIAYLFGYGFPRFRGGPMFFADSFGLFRMIREMKKFAANPHGNPEFWTPHPLLQGLSDSENDISKHKVQS